MLYRASVLKIGNPEKLGITVGKTEHARVIYWQYMHVVVCSTTSLLSLCHLFVIATNFVLWILCMEELAIYRNVFQHHVLLKLIGSFLDYVPRNRMSPPCFLSLLRLLSMLHDWKIMPFLFHIYNIYIEVETLQGN